MSQKLIYSLFLIFGLILVTPETSSAGDFGAHRRKIKKIEAQIGLLDDELEKKIEVKNTTRDLARVEDTLQRIVDIHAELISLRRELDQIIAHIREEHKEEGEALNMFLDVKSRLANDKRNRMIDPLQLRLDEMLQYVQSKYASLISEKENTLEIKQVERALETQKKKKEQRRSREYLRRKSKVKLVK